MIPAGSSQQSSYHPSARSIGRIASVTGSKAIVLLDTIPENDPRAKTDRAEMGMLLAIDTTNAIVLATVGALSVPVPAQGAENEIRIAELGLVGELTKDADVGALVFNRGTTTYPVLGDRVRLATKHELQLTYSGDGAETVKVGCIRQDTSIPAVVRIDDLLGKHFAVLGTTGTGKSCSTALILRAILEKNPNAHIVLLDPHNEYATAFGERAEIVSPRNMQLPLWLLNFEETVEVLVADHEHKAEIEILQELIPLAKIRYAAGRSSEPQRLRKGSLDSGRYTVDTPVPYRISDLTHLIDERMGKLENRKDLAPYRQLKTRIETLSQDGRYAFMFGSVAVYDSMAQVLSRVFRVPVRGKPITIVELTGLPPEVVNVVVSVLCRMAFDFALWGEGQVPVTVVCEEAHRYVPLNPQMGFEPCKRAIAKIAKEGRKYGVSLCIVTQRPAEIDPTILSQCNTVFALRMSNDRDQAIVSSAIADTGTGLLEFLPALGHREAIAFGDGVPLPVRIKFDELPAHALPRSSTAKFSDKWQYSVGDEGFLDAVVERWRAAGIGGLDMTAQAHLLAEAVDIPMGGSFRRADALSSDPGMERTHGTEQAADAAMYGGGHELSASATQHHEDEVRAPSSPEIDLWRSPPPMPQPVRRTEPPQREAASPAQSGAAGSSIARSALRERLLKPSNTR